MKQLHLGCGSAVVSGWENIDSSPSVLLARVPGLRPALGAVGVLSREQATAVFPEGIIRADVRKRLPYEDGSARFVYSSHLIEHLARWEGLALLRECHRVLAPGGVVRIATPDLAAIVGDYTRGDTRLGPTPADSFMAQLLTYTARQENSVRGVLRKLYSAPHQWLYDEESLGALFREAGFAEPMRRGFRESDLPDLEQLEQREESLFVEARRS